MELLTESLDIGKIYNQQNKNNKLLQIVITQYNDGEENIKLLLDSILLQRMVDFSKIGVIIINDGDKHILGKRFVNNFNKYPFDIDYYIEPWSGISGARQHGLDKVTAEYVMFCDGDDMLLRINALHDVFKIIKDQSPDIITSKFITDMYDNNGNFTHYNEYYKENVWIHGKFWKKEFLDKYNIKWNEKLKIYEDSYFVRLAYAMNPKKVDIEQPTYFWKYRDTSITRSDPDWVYRTYCEKVDSNIELVEQFIQRGDKHQAALYIWAQAYEMYFTSFEKDWDIKYRIPWKKQMEKKFIEYFSKYHEYLSLVNTEEEIVMMSTMRKRFYEQKHRVSKEPYSFEQFVYLMFDKYDQIDEDMKKEIEK